MEMTGRFRKLDIFKKVPKDLSQGTNVGGLISILTVLLMAYFLMNQLYKYFSPQIVAIISEDKLITRSQMKIVLDIQFPRFPCQIISLDLQDVMMSHHLNIGSISKWRLNSNGQYIDTNPFQLMNIHDRQKQQKLAEEAFKNNYGCRLKGSFTVKQVPGNFHISSHAYGSIFTHLFVSGVIKSLDVSHIIHQFYFGQYDNLNSIKNTHQQAQLQPLSDYRMIYDMSQTHSYTSHYHIDIVPTVYHDGYFQNIHAYQYTFNHNTYQVQHMPSVYFNYHIGGLMVSVYPSHSGILYFIISLCAVIGGIYTIANFLDNLIHQIIGSKHEYQLVQ